MVFPRAVINTPDFLDYGETNVKYCPFETDYIEFVYLYEN